LTCEAIGASDDDTDALDDALLFCGKDENGRWSMETMKVTGCLSS
jgi:hypothetical protein